MTYLETLPPLLKVDDLAVAWATLKPVRFVERELVSPDGTVVRVQVPVFGPPQLKRPAGTAGQR